MFEDIVYIDDTGWLLLSVSWVGCVPSKWNHICFTQLGLVIGDDILADAFMMMMMMMMMI